MNQLVIISGKGGTGKTVISAAFATLFQNKVLADCDVDAANLHLLLHPEVQEVHKFSGGQKAFLLPDKCLMCEECVEACRFDAIEVTNEDTIRIDNVSCEGCGVCSRVCPSQSIEMRDVTSGEWFVSHTKYGPFVHAKLGIGEENSGKLVTAVRKKSSEIAHLNDLDYIIIDGPPGIGCPVISALTGADITLIITEPTVAGIHDLQRLTELARGFQIPVLVCINKYDINQTKTLQIEEYCQHKDLMLIGKIPFDAAVVKAMVDKKTVMEYPCPTIHHAIEEMWETTPRPQEQALS